MSARKFTKCSFDGCRKKALKDGLCTKHAGHVEPTNVYPIDGVMRVTELEAAQFAAKDAEVRNTFLSAKNLELEIERAERAFTDQAIRHKLEQDKRRLQHAALEQTSGTQQASYKEFITELAKKYDLDPNKLAIDPDSRTIRDLRDGTPS